MAIQRARELHFPALAEEYFLFLMNQTQPQ